MNDIYLIKPSKKYQKSFENYALAYKEINDEHYYDKYKPAIENFQAYLDKLERYLSGVNLPPDRIQTSTFWLVDNEEVVGVVRIRHQADESAGHIGYDISPRYRKKGYGSMILKLALEKAIEIGLNEVILTCNVDNVASRKIIEKNNGIYISTIYDKEEDEHLYKFVIKLINSNYFFVHNKRYI